MNYCTKCVQPNTRPRIYFDEDGVCGACLWKEEKKSIDWDTRQRELAGIAAWAKAEASERGTYDCLLGVSGGKDTTYTALFARDRLGLNCLLVNAWPEKMTDLGRLNIETLSQLCISTEYSFWWSAYRLALLRKIPLIIQGENEALTLGASDGLNRDGDAAQVYRNNTMSGINAFQRYANFEGVCAKDLFLYSFPDATLLTRVGIRSVYLEYYTDEWDQVGNAKFAMRYGLKIRDDNLEELGSVHKFCALDADLWIVNQLLKYVKLGFGYATDEACYEVREGRITREEAFKLVRKYDGKCGEKYIRRFCDYIEITMDEFFEVVERYRNPDLVDRDWMAGIKKITSI